MAQQPRNPNPTNDPGAGNPAGGSGSQVNPKIVDAVGKSTGFVFGLADNVSGAPGSSAASSQIYNAGDAIAFEKVAQATAYEIQDAADYQRNMLSINGAAQGKALALMFEDVVEEKPVKFAEHALIYVLAIAGTFAAAGTSEVIGLSAADVLKKYGDATAQKTGS